MGSTGKDEGAAHEGRRPLPIHVTASYLASETGLCVLSSAGRHGVRAEEALHALAHSLRAFNVGQGMTMVIGPSPTGVLLEVGVVEWHGDLAVVHAMPARQRFLR